MIPKTRRAAAVEAYVTGFLARCDVLRGSGQSRVDRPGLHGVLAVDEPSATRLVIDDDRAIEVLPQLLAQIPGGTLNAFDTASGVLALLDGDDRWQGRPATAMVARDLDALTTAQLPCDLTGHPVRRTGSEPVGGVPLVEAVALAGHADSDDDSLATESLASHLRAMPLAVRLFAAVDSDGSVRGTSGVGVFGHHAHIVFVNTDLTRRREGIGRAMTTIALIEARGRGANTAYLDASGDGRRLYDAMGFQTVGALTRFTCRP